MAKADQMFKNVVPVSSTGHIANRHIFLYWIENMRATDFLVSVAASYTSALMKEDALGEIRV